MHFNTLVKNLLLENNDYYIKPKLDGKREIYTTYISTVNALGSQASMYDLYRMRSEQQFVEWDDTEVIDQMFYEGYDFNQAYTAWRTALYNEKRLVIHDQMVSRLLSEARKLKNIVGNFKVFHAVNDYVFGVEVDVAATRSLEIQDNLSNVDTSGFEDLL